MVTIVMQQKSGIGKRYQSTKYSAMKNSLGFVEHHFSLWLTFSHFSKKCFFCESVFFASEIEFEVAKGIRFHISQCVVVFVLLYITLKLYIMIKLKMSIVQVYENSGPQMPQKIA